MIEGKCHCGKVRWTFTGVPEFSNACNCTICRRYGSLWAYDYQGEKINVSGPTSAYEPLGELLAFHFCPNCGCVCYWRGLKDNDQGRRRIAVNLRMADPEGVAQISVRHFDGFDTFKPLRDDGRTVSHMWF